LLKWHVRNLRRKIDPSYLVSVRGMGYRLANPEE
jgi:DNA-binding response OmpR family regulator